MQERKVNGDPQTPAAESLAAVLTVIAEIFMIWCTIIAFVGGRVPIFGWEFEGSVGQGLVWLLFLSPLVGTIVYWAAIVLVAPVAYSEHHRRRSSPTHDDN
ncbi:MAG: hypothetical protein KatS3mg008_1707 [Acidimicrobiales bacterium]|nr:MAG: hypothetical protein KatS3mg008_1707 [Acidimicrobiales bacterium]